MATALAMAASALAVILGVSFVLGAAAEPADEDPSVVFAIGDLHGDVECARHWVRTSALVRNLDDEDPAAWQWARDDARIIFMGDYIDKGPEARHVVEFVRNLTTRFPGRVTALLGNHELNLLNDRVRPADSPKYLELVWGAAHPGQYASWLPERERGAANVSAALQAIHTALVEVYDRGLFRSTRLSADAGRASILSLVPAATRPLVERELRRWQRAYLDGVATGSVLGRWLEARPLTAIAADTAFVHGGIPRALRGGVPLSRAALRDLNEGLLQHSTQELLPDFLARNPAAQELVEYRGLHTDCAEVADVCRALNVSRIAVGHTPADEVRSLCGGRLLALDSALGRWFRASGNSYCTGSEDGIGPVSKSIVCPRKHAECEGQVTVFTRAADGGSWSVRIVDSTFEGVSAGRLADEL